GRPEHQRPPLVRHLRAGRAGRREPGRRRSAGRSAAEGEARHHERCVAVRRPPADLLQLRSPARSAVRGPLPDRGGRMPRPDQGIKFFKILTETGAPSQLASRQPDTDEYRRWEVAGTAHADFYFVSYLTPLGERDGIPPTPMGCDRPPLSQMPFYQVGNAAGDALVRWMTDGTPPPIGPPIAFASISPPVIPRDPLGLALGGIRLPDIEAPLALDTGTNSGPVFCRLFGTHIPFDDATLHQLYARRGDWI